MCGLVGIVGDLAYKDEATMQRLLLFDYIRGTDATGLAVIRNTGETFLAKTNSHPIDLFDMGRFKTALNGNNSKVFIGHNRAATSGDKSSSSAHPFMCDHIIGAHNGTLEYRTFRKLEEALGETFSVDSNALMAAIAKFGIDKTVKMLEDGKTFEKGAWSLVWYDMNDGTFNMLRNKWRPMWYAFEEGFKKMFFASEWWMIDAAMRSSVNGYKLHIEHEKDADGTEQAYRFFQTSENIHYKFDVDALKKGSDKRPKPKARSLAAPVPKEPEPEARDPFGREYPIGFGPVPSGKTTNIELLPTANQNTGTRHSGGKRSRTHPNEPKKIAVIHLLGDIGKPYAGYVPYEKFEAVARHGCNWCQKKVPYGTKGVTIYEKCDTFLCPECSGYSPATENPETRVVIESSTMDKLA
jgi:predicted glutamine amidotransferase